MAIFVNYRREDSESITGRIDDKLRDKFGSDDVYRDIDSIPPGSNFVEHLKGALDRCDVCLIVIGRHWLSPRLANENDWVRLEIEAVLKRGIPLLPVLVERAQMPSDADLPASLRPLRNWNALTIDSGADFRTHVARLVDAIERIRARAAQVETQRQLAETARKDEERRLAQERSAEADRPTEEKAERSEASRGRREKVAPRELDPAAQSTERAARQEPKAVSIRGRRARKKRGKHTADAGPSVSEALPSDVRAGATLSTPTGAPLRARNALVAALLLLLGATVLWVVRRAPTDDPAQLAPLVSSDSAAVPPGTVTPAQVQPTAVVLPPLPEAVPQAFDPFAAPCATAPRPLTPNEMRIREALCSRQADPCGARASLRAVKAIDWNERTIIDKAVQEIERGLPQVTLAGSRTAELKYIDCTDSKACDGITLLEGQPTPVCAGRATVRAVRASDQVAAVRTVDLKPGTQQTVALLFPLAIQPTRSTP